MGNVPVKEEKKKDLEKLNRQLNRFLQNPRLPGFAAIVAEMERLMPGQGIKEAAERAKNKRFQESINVVADDINC